MYKTRFLNKNISIFDKIIFNILIVTLSFLSSRIMIIGNFPLGISVVSSVKNLPASIFGAFIGYFSLGKTSLSVRYVSTIIAVCLMRFLLSDFKPINNYVLHSVIVNFIPIFATGISSRLAYGLNFNSFTECVLESFISMGFSCFLKFAFSFFYSKKEKFNSLILPITIFLIISPFFSLKIFSISLINIISISILLYISYCMKTLGGSICGIIQGIIYMILRPDSKISMISFSISGLLTGISSKFGKFFMVLVYIVSNLIIHIQLKEDINHSNIIEMLLGISLFIYFSEKNLAKYFDISIFSNESSHQAFHLLANQNISIIRQALKKLKMIFNNVSTKTDKNFKSDSKNLVNSYLDNINKIFDNVLDSIEIEINENLSMKIRKNIEKIFKTNVEVSCGENFFKKTVVQLEFHKFDIPNNLEKLEEELCFLCGKSFMKPEIFENDSLIVMRICEKPSLHPCLMHKQHITTGEKYCGDSFKTFFDGLGKFYVVMCDGMGTGNDAAISGNLTSEVIRNTIRGGIDFKTSISIANSFLMSKSNDESLSTVDIFALNLYSGEAEFIKAGAASSFVRKGRDVAKISSDTFPIGILPEFNVSKTNCKLEKEDIVLIISDGITDTGEDWIEKMLRDEVNVINLNDKILKKAINLRKKSNDDDITSIMVKI